MLPRVPLSSFAFHRRFNLREAVSLSDAKTRGALSWHTQSGRRKRDNIRGSR